jgi:hypothetical protein
LLANEACSIFEQGGVQMLGTKAVFGRNTAKPNLRLFIDAILLLCFVRCTYTSSLFQGAKGLYFSNTGPE